MKRAISFALALLLSAAAGAAEPSAAASPPAVASRPTAENAGPTKPLDLRIGDIRKYMTPDEFRAAIHNTEANTVVVEANRELLPVKYEDPVPGGIIAPFWALFHPTQAWRIFVPNLNSPALKPPDTKVPPPVFRWGP